MCVVDKFVKLTECNYFHERSVNCCAVLAGKYNKVHSQTCLEVDHSK